jgi:glucokinase
MNLVLEELIQNALSGDSKISITGAAAGLPEFVNNGEVASQMVINWGDSCKEVVERVLGELNNPGVELLVESDVRCGAIGESRFGAHATKEPLLYVSWGTGVSSTLILPGGECLQGANGAAIALGETQVEVNGVITTLEKTASGFGISQAYKTLTTKEITALEIAELSEKGDSIALQVLDQASSLMAKAISDLIYVLDPQVVVIGGGIGAAKSKLANMLLNKFNSNGMGRHLPCVVSTELANDAGLLGAAVVAFESQKLS